MVSLTHVLNDIVMRGVIIKDKYVIRDYIRGGGFGDVFLAKHFDKNYDIAVKFVRLFQTYLILTCRAITIIKKQ